MWFTSAIGGAAVLAFIALLLRHSLAQWVTASIRHHYDRQLEAIRAANEKELQQLRNALEAQTNLVSSAFLDARRASNERRLSAIQAVWDAMMDIFFAVPNPSALTDFLTSDTYQQFFEAIRTEIPTFLAVAPLYGASAPYMLPVEKARLLSGEFLYAVFWAYRAFVGSIALDLSLSRDRGQRGEFRPWWENDHVLNNLRAALDSEEWEIFASTRVGRYTWVTRTLEAKFLRAAEDIIDGRRATTDAFEEATRILTAARSSLSQQTVERGESALGS
jgi:hypothetical protein